jgi:hypothetical protein
MHSIQPHILEFMIPVLVMNMHKCILMNRIFTSLDIHRYSDHQTWEIPTSYRGRYNAHLIDSSVFHSISIMDARFTSCVAPTCSSLLTYDCIHECIYIDIWIDIDINHPFINRLIHRASKIRATLYSHPYRCVSYRSIFSNGRIQMN